MSMYPWETDELGTTHGGQPGVVAKDGEEPGPISIPSMSGGGTMGRITEWWGYDGQMSGPVGTHLRGSCSCGWRGTELYPVDWAEVREQHPYEYDTSGPEADWKAHVKDVESRLVPLPDDLAELLDRLSRRLSELSDDEPLAVLRAANIARRDSELFAGSAVMTIRRHGPSTAAVGVALGCSADEAETRMRRYYGHF
ncbi:hypothetical protein [Streptomyces sp. cmx-18-6]|uniref:hypothetical protein n=1 Tax=Streptomyces sp. cmx-18-6 TaxID=2790930 RepID=UPI00397FFA6F